MRRCGPLPIAAWSLLLRRRRGLRLRWRNRGLVARQVRTFLVLGASRGRRTGNLPLLTDRMQVVRDSGPLVVRDHVLLGPAHEDPGDRHAAAADGHMSVHDELPRLSRGEGESLQECEGLESAGEDGLHVEREHVVEGRALERQEPKTSESSEELFAFLFRLLVADPHARLELPRPLSESPQNVLGAPQFLLVLQAIFLQQFVLRLDALRFPRMGGPLELRSGKLRIAQRLTPWPVPSSLLSSLPSSGKLPPPSSPGRRRGRPSSSPRRSARSGRWTACVARGPSVRSRGGRPCTNESSSCG